MRPSKLLHSLSLRIPAKFASSLVTPLLEPSTFDQWLTDELDRLRIISSPSSSMTSYMCMNIQWLLATMEVAIVAQNNAMEVITGAGHREEYWEVVDKYVDNVLELLDACQGLRDRAELVRTYVEVLRSVTRCLGDEAGPSHAGMERARVMLGRLEMARKRWDKLDRYNSGRRRPWGRFTDGPDRVEEVLNGSHSVALLACRTLSTGLSLKSNRRFTLTQTPRFVSWAAYLDQVQKEVKNVVHIRRTGGRMPVLDELRTVITAEQELRQILRQPDTNASQEELRATVESLSKNCATLEEGIKRVEGRVDDLYRNLISVRMALLDILSRY